MIKKYWFVFLIILSVSIVIGTGKSFQQLTTGILTCRDLKNNITNPSKREYMLRWADAVEFEIKQGVEKDRISSISEGGKISTSLLLYERKSALSKLLKEDFRTAHSGDYTIKKTLDVNVFGLGFMSKYWKATLVNPIEKSLNKTEMQRVNIVENPEAIFFSQSYLNGYLVLLNGKELNLSSGLIEKELRENSESGERIFPVCQGRR